jgi:DNA polymerase III delta subunit
VPDLFEIAESLAAGHPGQCLALFERAMQVGRDPIEVLAVELIPQLRRMLIAAALLARKKNPGEIAAAMGVAPSSPLAARSIEGARRFGLNRLQRAHRQACELDAAFKMGLRKDREQAVAAMILELTSG